MPALIYSADCARQAERLGERVAEDNGSAGDFKLNRVSCVWLKSSVMTRGLCAEQQWSA